MTQQSADQTAADVTEENAERVVADLNAILDDLLRTVEEETAQVRAGHLRKAVHLSDEKIALSRRYALESARMRASQAIVERVVPNAIEALRLRHETFHNVLKKNLTVLATAHAVSEGIIRGVSGELARKQVPSTYGATGRANTPGPKASQPLAISRSL